MDDYENLTTVITSLPGDTTLSGSVEIIDDNDFEGFEDFTLHLHNCTNTVAGCSLSRMYLVINITDNDGMYFILYIELGR